MIHRCETIRRYGAIHPIRSIAQKGGDPSTRNVPPLRGDPPARHEIDELQGAWAGSSPKATHLIRGKNGGLGGGNGHGLDAQDVVPVVAEESPGKGEAQAMMGPACGVVALAKGSSRRNPISEVFFRGQWWTRGQAPVEDEAEKEVRRILPHVKLQKGAPRTGPGRKAKVERPPVLRGLGRSAAWRPTSWRRPFRRDWRERGSRAWKGRWTGGSFPPEGSGWASFVRRWETKGAAAHSLRNHGERRRVSRKASTSAGGSQGPDGGGSGPRRGCSARRSSSGREEEGLPESSRSVPAHELSQALLIELRGPIRTAARNSRQSER